MNKSRYLLLFFGFLLPTAPSQACEVLNEANARFLTSVMVASHKCPWSKKKLEGVELGGILVTFEAISEESITVGNCSAFIQKSRDEAIAQADADPDTYCERMLQEIEGQAVLKGLLEHIGVF